MNYNNAAVLIDEKVTTLDATFDIIHIPQKLYTFKVSTELASTLEPGDMVLADTANGIITVYVKEIHEEAKIELSSTRVYKWVFQKVDTSKLKELNDNQKAVVKALKEQRQPRSKAKRQSVLNDLGIIDFKYPKVNKEPSILTVEEIDEIMRSFTGFEFKLLIESVKTFNFKCSNVLTPYYLCDLWNETQSVKEGVVRRTQPINFF